MALSGLLVWNAVHRATVSLGAPWIICHISFIVSVPLAAGASDLCGTDPETPLCETSVTFVLLVRCCVLLLLIQVPNPA